MASEKKCLYQILGLNKDCSPEEIRSAYKKLALQRHPDKLIQTGVSEKQATAIFQELSHAYELLSDPSKRTSYDSHSSETLFSDPESSPQSGPVADLSDFISTYAYSGFGDEGRGFYKVYGDVFHRVYIQEVRFAKKVGLGDKSVRVPPSMGNLETRFKDVKEFYSYWLGFATVMDFSWVDEYDPLVGKDEKTRKIMEQENEKLRNRARKEYNDTVWKLADFVKKKDKRILDNEAKKVVEIEKKKEEQKAQKKKADGVKSERAKSYKEPNSAKTDKKEAKIVSYEEEEVDNKTKNNVKELFCDVCSKKFKSDNQLKNHEQSKKHQEKVAERRGTCNSNEEEDEDSDNGFDVSERTKTKKGHKNAPERKNNKKSTIRTKS